jgi:GT2 family glycosyltransferase
VARASAGPRPSPVPPADRSQAPSATLELSVVIPTLGRPGLLRRVLDRLDDQSAPATAFEVLVVADANEAALQDLDRIVRGREYGARRLQADRPGASAARNTGWRAAEAAVVLFLDDDILPEPGLIAGHCEWHRRHPGVEVGVLGDVRWADELRVTPFMRWLERGIQFDYLRIEGTDAGWSRFYTANVSVKRELVELVGGFEEEELPFGYEDLDLALRMRHHGLRLLYNRAASAEHLHPMDLDFWKRRVARIALSEHRFVARHPEIRPYFHDLFAASAAEPAARGRGARLTRIVPPWVPLLGRWVWGSADAVYRQALAKPFLDAWRAVSAQDSSGPARPASPSGSSPGGPK